MGSWIAHPRIREIEFNIGQLVDAWQSEERAELEPIVLRMLANTARSVPIRLMACLLFA